MFTEDSLANFLCELELVINQQRLTPINDSLYDLKAITPYHFLVHHHPMHHLEISTNQNGATEPNGNQYKQQQICFGGDGQKNVFQHYYI